MESVITTSEDEFVMAFKSLNMQGFIDPNAMARAQAVVNAVNEVVYNHMTTEFPQFKMRSSQAQAFVLQGSVADGTKVLAPDEFDYLIPMDLSDEDWTVIPSTEINDSTLDIMKGESAGLYYIARRNQTNRKLWEHCDDKNTKRKRRKITRRRTFRRGIEISSSREKNTNTDLCEHCVVGETISANRTFNEFRLNLCKLVPYSTKCNHIFSDFNYYVISNVEYGLGGPAITLTVEYKLDDCKDETFSKLKIDYVPAVCIGGQTFVSKSNSHDSSPSCSMFWRESFSDEEQALMKEIQLESPLIFRLFQIVKVVHAAVVHSLLYQDMRRYDALSMTFVNIILFILSQDTISMHTKRGEEMSLALNVFVNGMIRLTTYHLKTILFHMWKEEKLRNANVVKVTVAYCLRLKDCLSKGLVKHFFNGLNLQHKDLSEVQRLIRSF